MITLPDPDSLHLAGECAIACDCVCDCVCDCMFVFCIWEKNELLDLIIGCVEMQYYQFEAMMTLMRHTNKAILSEISKWSSLYKVLAFLTAEYVGLDYDLMRLFGPIVTFVRTSPTMILLESEGALTTLGMVPILPTCETVQLRDPSHRILTIHRTDEEYYQPNTSTCIGVMRDSVVANVFDPDLDSADHYHPVTRALHVDFSGSFIARSTLRGFHSQSSFRGAYFYRCKVFIHGFIDFTGAIFHDCVFDFTHYRLTLQDVYIHCSNSESRRRCARFVLRNQHLIDRFNIKVVYMRADGATE